MSRHVVGIDLGTTNSAVATAPADAKAPVAATSVPIQQVVGPGAIDARSSLPSFLLLATEAEVAAAELALPWSPAMKYVVGTYARDRGAELPHRLVASAKSWLCAHTVDRTAAVLPWRGAERLAADVDGERVSPVNASARYLAHLRAAWDDGHEDDPLYEQDVLLTVPASFDAAARELTAVAAREAGLDSLTLLEEPQAAFYAYLAARGDAWRDDLRPGDVVLVCDVGGGTTDFSLIEVRDAGGELVVERVAVGDHILLGGDNMDLTLAALVGQRLEADGKTLDSLQERGLVHACRRAKEQLLGGDVAAAQIALLGRGSKLLGKTVRTELARADALGVLVDGFFPVVEADAAPAKRRAGGLRELGLPYAHDPAITRHLAEFLARHGRMPTGVLFNGGVMKAAPVRARMHEVLARWCGTPVRELAPADLDLAVSLGAAYYGQVRRGRGIRIRGGTARAYYIGIESSMPAIPGFAPPIKALCVAPRGMEEGTAATLPDDELGLVVGEVSSFRFFASSSREGDTAGALIDGKASGLVELDPVEKLVPAEDGRAAGDLVPIRLEAQISELGTLELWCQARDGAGRWKLEYSVRERS